MAAATVQPSTHRLAYIEGLRGIAALVVATGHTVGMVPPDHPAGTFFQADLEHKLLWPWLFGGQMVWLFLMVSGFALYYSELRRRERRPPSTLREYGLRRAWRIAPTYYLALAIGVGVVVVSRPFYLRPSPSLDTAHPITASGMLAHVSFIHTLRPEWFNQANPPLWSIAVEVQLYLLFPIVMLAVWRRVGGPWLPAAGLFVACRVIDRVTGLPLFSLVDFFLVGVLVAEVVTRVRVPRRLLGVFAAAMLLVGFVRLSSLTGRREELVWLVGCAALLAAMHGIRATKWNVTTWGPMQWLGARSYSLYAVHFPVVLLVWMGVGRVVNPRPERLVAMAAIGLPAALVVSSVIYHLVEEPSKARVARVGKERATERHVDR